MSLDRCQECDFIFDSDDHPEYYHEGYYMTEELRIPHPRQKNVYKRIQKSKLVYTGDVPEFKEHCVVLCDSCLENLEDQNRVAVLK